MANLAVQQGGNSFSGSVTATNNSTVYQGNFNINNNERPRNPWTVPREINRLYTGRVDIAKKLEHALEREDETLRNCQRRFVICGLGGTGKSEVCLKYAWDHRQNNESNAKQDFERIGYLCGISEPKIDTVKDFLANTTERWLLIVDNADDIKMDYSKYFPTGHRHSIIITTRNPNLVGKVATAGTESLDQLDSELAAHLLLRASGIAEIQWPDRTHVATKIINALGCHTLAILSAGAFIQQTCHLDDYLRIYHYQHDQAQFQVENDQEETTYGTVYTTFEVSAKHIEMSTKQGSVNARNSLQLLHMLAFMHYEGTIEHILSEAAAYASSLLEGRVTVDATHPLNLSKFHAAQLPSFSPKPSKGAEGYLRWRGAVNLLKSFSLVTEQEKSGFSTLSLHPLVHSWARLRQDPDSRPVSWLKASSALALSCKGQLDYDPMFDTLRSHVRVCLGPGFEVLMQQTGASQTVGILWQLGWVQYRTFEDYNSDIIISSILTQLHGQVVAEKEEKKKKEKRLKRLLRRWTSSTAGNSGVESRNDVVVARIQRLSGIWRLQRGDIRQAIVDLEHSYNTTKELDEGHPERLASQHTIASAYLRNNQVEDAIKLLEHVTRIEEKKLDKEHPNRLVSQHELASAYLKNDQVEDAIKLLEHVTRIMETNLDEGHPERLTSQYTIASAYLRNNQVEDAIKLLEHVTRIREKNLDEGHPERLASQDNLGRAYLKSGQIQEATKLLEHVVSVRKQVLSEGHPKLAWSKTLLDRARRKAQARTETHFASPEIPGGITGD